MGRREVRGGGPPAGKGLCRAGRSPGRRKNRFRGPLAAILSRFHDGSLSRGLAGDNVPGVLWKSGVGPRSRSRRQKWERQCRNRTGLGIGGGGAVDWPTRRDVRRKPLPAPNHGSTFEGHDFRALPIRLKLAIALPRREGLGLRNAVSRTKTPPPSGKKAPRLQANSFGAPRAGRRNMTWDVNRRPSRPWPRSEANRRCGRDTQFISETQPQGGDRSGTDAVWE